MRRIGIATLFLLLVAIVAANYSAASGVLTLTGTCKSPILTASNNTIYFYLSSVGNASASNLQVIPRFQGASVSPYEESLNSLRPGENASFSFNVSNFTEPGSYVGELILEYIQGGSTFFTMFPCQYDIGKQTQSLVSILNITATQSSVKSTLISLGNQPVNVSIYMLYPPLFQTTPVFENTTLEPLSKYNVEFQLSSMPSLLNGSTVPLGLVVSYTKGGEHYTSLGATLLQVKTSSKPHMPLVYIFIGIFVAIIAIILALILVAFSKSKKAKPKNSKNRDEA
ncbi:MAG: hypothetical protein ACP5NE_01495 [Candidatus Micrarchaeia archaeon]